MASSSVSQESLDIEDYELNARKSRVRAMRAQRVLNPRVGEREQENVGDCKDLNGEDGMGISPDPVGIHDSPTRSSAVQRAKDKRARQKGKLPKDKRKLREKRRSTGVVHLQSTESTGDSLDDDDNEEEKCLNEAKRNTAYNEVIDADNPQTPSEVSQRIRQFQNITVSSKNSVQNMAPRGYRNRRNKSPSDLDADLEDNQDYDSTYSQSDSNLTLIDQSDAKDSEHAPKVPARTYNQSKFTAESTTSFKPNVSNFESKHAQSSTPQLYSVKSPAHTKSQTDSVNKNAYQFFGAPKSPKSHVPSSSSSQNASLVQEPVRPVSSVLARYQQQEKDKQEEQQTTGYKSRFRDREYGGVRGPIGQQFAASLLNKDNKEEEKKKLEKELEQQKEENKRLQRMLEEKDSLIAQQNKRIAELERDMGLMNKDLEDFEEENQKLHIENQALIRAVGQLSTHGSSHV